MPGSPHAPVRLVLVAESALSSMFVKTIATPSHTDCYIGGGWREASGAERFEVLDPATEQVLGTVADASVPDVLEAVAAAHEALGAWSATPPRRRGEILRRAFELMIERTDELARLMVRENGKALGDARAEIAYAAEFFRWFSEEAVRNTGEIVTAPAGTNRILVLRQPIGVALLVTPWNFPAAMLTRKIGPALAAGTTVVCKPAKETPLSALAIAAILDEAGAPPGVVNVVPTSQAGKLVDAALADDRVRKLSFTGSTEVGRMLLEKASSKVVSSSMELGGNAPFVIFADANLDDAVAGAMLAKMRNGGEACTAANRFYVEAPIADEFVTRLTAQMAAVRMGNGLEEGVQLGPLVNADSRDKVADLVDAALSSGAHATTGGSLPTGPGFFYPATVLDHVSPGSPILSNEIFGPVAPVVTFHSEKEAIELANDTIFGLVSYVYTADLARGLRFSEALETGMVGLNRGLVSDPSAPFGGVKQSGLGREGGHEGMNEYLETKYIAVSW
jgi:succinate-semialdehyde dehydrogenase / glutarate-semialdehyde dehydrogenase